MVGSWSVLNDRLRVAAPILFLMGVMLLIFWPILFGGYTLYPADLLHEAYLPFAAYRSGTNVQVTAIIDYIHTFYPLRFFVWESLREGQLPLWNPFIWGGHPAFASQGSVVTLDPFNALYLFLDLPVALAWRTFLQVVACSVFMYLYLRNLRLGQPASLLGGLAFSLSSMFYVNVFDWSLSSILWLPLILLFIDRALDRASFVYGLIAGLVLGVGLLSSVLQFFAFIVLAIAGLYLLRYLIVDRARFKVLPYFSTIGLILVIGLLIASVQFLPALELVSHSVRRLTDSGQGVRSFYGMMTGTLALVTFLFPNLGGRLKEGMMLAQAWEGTTHFQGYIGVFSFLLATIAVICGDRRRTLPYVFLGLGGIAVVLYTPLSIFLYERFFIIYIFVAAVLAGRGADYLLGDTIDRVKVRTILRCFVIVFITIAVGVALWSVVFTLYRGPILESAEAYLRSILPERYLGNNLALHLRKLHRTLYDLTLFSPAMSVPLALSFISIGLIQGRADLRWGPTVFGVVGIVLSSAELSYSAVTHIPFVNLKEYPLFPPTPAVEVMQKDPHLFRVMSLRRYSIEPPLLSVSMPSVYGLQTVEGKDNLYPENLWTILPRELTSSERYLPTDFRLLNLLNVKYMMVGRATKLPGDQFELIYEDGVRVYRNKDVMPRAFFVSAYVVVSDRLRALGMLRSREFEPSRVVILETDPEVPQAGEIVGEKTAVEITRYTPTLLDIDVETKRPGFLVLSDTYFPGWRAMVDGRRGEIFRANAAMRAIYLSPGHHRVTFLYSPTSFRLGLAVSVSTFFLTCLALTCQVIRKARMIPRRAW